jgi:sugar transferase (PEP-CTERM system associated)
MIRIAGLHIPRRVYLLVVSDSILITCGLLLATTLRFSLFGSGGNEDLNSSQTTVRFLVVALVGGLALYYNELYDFRIVRHRSVMLVRLFQALGISCLVLAVLYYLKPEWNLGRGIAALAAPMVLTLLLGLRLILHRPDFFTHSAERVLVVGTAPAGISLAREIIERPELNNKVVGFLDEKGEDLGRSLINPRIIGAVSETERIVRQESIDRVILALKERRGNMPVGQLVKLKFAGVSVEDAHSYFEKVTGRILIEHLSPSWLILSDGFRKSRFLLAAKRLLDLAVSLLALPVAAPLMGMVAVAVWLESGRPILFRQKRVGLGEEEFEILKFRSMYHNAEAEGPRWATDGDPRITRAGRFIRKYRLDELPQLFNVIRGDMSLVGPRPEQPHLCTILQQQIPLFVERHSVRPGITGWAQIKYEYGSSVEQAERKLEHDLYYIKHLSLFLDVAIILETFKVMVIGRGAK